MGEIADMMLDGILDANGEYTGMDLGYPYEFYKKRKRPNAPSTASIALKGVRRYVRHKFGNEQQLSHYKIRLALEKYAEIINHPLIGDHETGDDWDTSISEVIQKDFGKFVKWFRTYKAVNLERE